MGITGSGSDVAADLCWELPEDVRDVMTIEDKSNYGCRCMGLGLLDQNSCNYPGLGVFYNPALADPEPVPPTPLEDPPPEPALPERPIEPVDQSDSVAMADFFTALQEWEGQANDIQAAYKQELETYQAKSEVFKTEMIAYQQSLAEWQIARTSAVSPAEIVVNQFYNDFGWTYVNKEDNLAYWGKLLKTWIAQSSIILVLFVGILLLQKRKDVN